MAVLKNSIIVAFWTGASRGLGFARDLLIANRLGAGMASDAFFIALQLPNLLRRLLGEGAFNVAFVPLFAKEKAKGDEAALVFANVVFSWLFVTLLAVTVLGVALMPWVVTAMVPGWTGDVEKFTLTVALGRVTFPYLMLICLAAFIGAVCNTYGKFAAYAVAPALLNFSFIGLLLFYPQYGPQLGISPATVAAWAVPIGGVMQLGFMVWMVKRLGIRLRLRLPRGEASRHPALLPMVKRMGPAAIGVGVLQLSVLIDNFVASWIGEGAVSYLQYANRFYQLPLALIGIAVATVLLPHLAVLFGEGNKREASRSFVDTLVGCLTLAAGATTVLFLLAPEMMSTLLAHGQFSATDAQATAWAMMAFVIGLPAYIITKVTAPAFFASEDPMSPVKASAIALLVNFVLNIFFVVLGKALGLSGSAHVGIALATAIGGAVNAYLQWRWLQQRGIVEVDLAPLRAAVSKMAGVALAMAVPLVLAKAVYPLDADWNLLLKMLWLAVVGGVGGLMFVAGIQLSGLVDIVAFGKQFKAARASKRHIDPKLRAAMRGEE